MFASRQNQPGMVRMIHQGQALRVLAALKALTDHANHALWQLWR